MPWRGTTRIRESFYLPLQQRLDRDTSGLTVISKHLVSASIMADMTKKRLVHREYLAIVKGDLTPPTGTITAPPFPQRRLHH